MPGQKGGGWNPITVNASTHSQRNSFLLGNKFYYVTRDKCIISHEISP